MRRSKIVVCLHFVWATKGREPLIKPEIERDIYRCISHEAEQMGSAVLAIGGMPDHVHLLVKFSSKVSFGEFMKRIKGVSSALANDLQQHKSLFRWQEGYAVNAVSQSHQAAALAYVRNQKQHHADGTTLPEWEETDEEYCPETD